MNRIFENEALIIVDKPVNWLTTPAREADDPRPCLGRRLQDELGLRIFPVHRLDFEVSGLVLFAKTAAAHRLAQAWFEGGRVTKTYRALSGLAPGWPAEWTEWRSQLAKGKRRAFRAAHGKAALTRARAQRAGDQLRWTLEPRTGRSHQLRFELADHGWPILGDVLYGAEPRAPESGIALRAVSLDFEGVGERMGLPAVVAGPDLED